MSFVINKKERERRKRKRKRNKRREKPQKEKGREITKGKSQNRETAYHMAVVVGTNKQPYKTLYKFHHVTFFWPFFFNFNFLNEKTFWYNQIGPNLNVVWSPDYKVNKKKKKGKRDKSQEVKPLSRRPTRTRKKRVLVYVMLPAMFCF